ncbi:hypothetical protein HPG69_007296 [Diceros bicornis minor]|uniref:Uncharacterized protein n=1 Tax=Diceros bicornis minor TaxID=77932 RepID=A0A7J7FNK3_DICBM|nr:hypothetical protein HPG69_007296 [Diceros bicornis minor]
MRKIKSLLHSRAVEKKQRTKDVKTRSRKELKWSKERRDESDAVPVKSLKSLPCSLRMYGPSTVSTSAISGFCPFQGETSRQRGMAASALTEHEALHSQDSVPQERGPVKGRLTTGLEGPSQGFYPDSHGGGAEFLDNGCVANCHLFLGTSISISKPNVALLLEQGEQPWGMRSEEAGIPWPESKSIQESKEFSLRKSIKEETFQHEILSREGTGIASACGNLGMGQAPLIFCGRLQDADLVQKSQPGCERKICIKVRNLLICCSHRGDPTQSGFPVAVLTVTKLSTERKSHSTDRLRGLHSEGHRGHTDTDSVTKAYTGAHHGLSRYALLSAALRTRFGACALGGRASTPEVLRVRAAGFRAEAGGYSEVGGGESGPKGPARRARRAALSRPCSRSLGAAAASSPCRLHFPEARAARRVSFGPPGGCGDRGSNPVRD